MIQQISRYWIHPISTLSSRLHISKMCYSSLNSMKPLLTSYMFLDPTSYSKCVDTFKKCLPDYYCYPISIFKKGLMCPKRGTVSFNHSPLLSNSLRLPDTGGFIMLEKKFHHLNHSCKSLDMNQLMCIMKSFVKKSLFKKRIVVSICLGKGETEMESDDLCLCLNVDRQSMFASCFAKK